MLAVVSVIGIDNVRGALIVAFILLFDSFFNMVSTVSNAASNLSVA